MASNLKWHHNQGLWTPLIQVMACCLMVIALSHELNQFSLIISEIHWKSCQGHPTEVPSDSNNKIG